MHIVIAGHVDHGKSTVIGRMLADTGSLPDGKLQQVRENCERNSKPFEYAFLLDALKDEQSQGITIDAARVFFETPKRPYVILDAPGHIEFLKNMITGASHAEAALLVIDANEGVQENSRRHGYMLAMLGIRQLAVVVNKMDLVDYDERTFRRVVDEYTAFLKSLDVEAQAFLPVSGMEGDNVATSSERMPWFDGPTVLDALDAFEEEAPPADQDFRMTVQDVYKFTRHGDDRRIVAGAVESGRLRVGDDVVFFPSGKGSRVKTIESFSRPEQTETTAGAAAGFTLEEQIYVTRGEIAARVGEARPEVSTRLRVSLFWLGRNPLVPKKEYLIKLGTAKIPMRVEAIERVLDASNLDSEDTKDRVDRHEVAECVLKLRKPMAFDLASTNASLGRFVLVEDYDIRGGGIVREALPDARAEVREQVWLRNNHWEKSFVDVAQRAERYNQKPALVLITGPKEGNRKEVAKALERRLFAEGKLVYYLGFGSVLYGIDADTVASRGDPNDIELMRRLAEVGHILLDAGVILIVTAQELSQDELEVFKTVVDPDQIETVWAGSRVTTDLAFDLHVDDASEDDSVDRIKARLQERGVVFTPW